MEFPIPAGRDESVTGTDQTSHTVRLDGVGSIVAGDGLLIVSTNDGDTDITFPNEGTDWIVLFDVQRTPSTRTKAVWRKADGGEAATITVTTTAAEELASRVWRFDVGDITDWAAIPPAVGVATQATSSQPDSPSLTVPWQVGENNWWVTVEGNDHVDSVSIYPVVTTDQFTHSSSANAGACSQGFAEKYDTALDTWDPTLFNLGGSEQWVANTIVVAPAGAGGAFIVLDGDASWVVDYGSLTIEHRVAERSTATLKVWDLEGTRGRVLKGTPISIIDPNSVFAFDGYVEDPVGIRPNPDDTPVGWTLSCTDFHYLADKRTFADGFLATAAGTIVTAIIDQVLVEEGVTAGTIEAGPTLDEAVFNYVSCTRALDRLAAVSNKTWWIDAAKVLFFIAPTGPVAATITRADMKEPPQVRPQSPDYRNRQVIRGIKGYTDPQTEDFTGNGVLQSFVTSYPIGRVPAIKWNTVVQTVGIRGIDIGKNWYWSKGSPVVSQEPANTPVQAGDTLEVIYDGLFDLVAILDDDAEQIRLAAIEGGPSSGIVESVLQVNDVFGRQAAFDIGAGLLTTFAQEGMTVTLMTARTDLPVGAYVTLVLPELDIASEVFLVVAVASRDLARSEWEYDVTLVQGADPGSWQTRLARGLAEPDVLVIRENISEEQTLIILEQFAEGWTWAETSVTQTVFACPVPSTTLFPATTLLPC